MNKYQHRGGVQSLISTLFNLQLFAYKEVTNPYVINPIKKKNYKTKADASSTLVDLSYYAQFNIPDYQSITEIPQDNLNYLNSGLVATDMSLMFASCNNLKTIPKLNIDTSQCTNMSSMFYYCQTLTTIDLSNLNTGSVTNMGSMFYNCEALTTINLSNWDTSNVTDMSNMFYDCYALTSLDLSNWDTSKVTDMWVMFYDCQALEHIEGIIDMKSCTKYNGMFYGCDKLSGVKIKNPPANFESNIGLTPDQYEIVS